MSITIAGDRPCDANVVFDVVDMSSDTAAARDLFPDVDLSKDIFVS